MSYSFISRVNSSFFFLKFNVYYALLMRVAWSEHVACPLINPQRRNKATK